MKHVVKFSGGAASSYVAWLVAEEYGRENTILLHTPTYSEHPCADRFRAEVADYIGLPITVSEDGRDLWQLIRDNHCIPSNFIPFCTRILKAKPSDKFFKNLGCDYLSYIGFGPDEWRRVQRASARDPLARFPLFEKKIQNSECKRIIRDEWGIALPVVYQHLGHNNCLPCFKGGKGHFKAVFEHYPDYFQKAVDAEKLIGFNVFDVPLTEMAAKWMGEPKQCVLPEQPVPCECWSA